MYNTTYTSMVHHCLCFCSMGERQVPYVSGAPPTGPYYTGMQAGPGLAGPPGFQWAAASAVQPSGPYQVCAIGN